MSRVPLNAALLGSAITLLPSDYPLFAADELPPFALTLDNAEPAPPSPTATPVPTPIYPATGDWGGTRTTLANKGLTFGGSILFDLSRNLTGGLTHHVNSPRYLLDLNFTLDTEKLLGWRGGTLFIDFESHDGPNASVKQTADLQGFDGIDDAHFTQLYQLWYQQLLAGDKVHIKLGKIDANADFSVIDHGKEFLNSAMSYSTTIVPFVTYPDPAPGGEIFYNPTNHLYLGVGAFYSNQHQTVLDFVGHPETIEHSSGGTFLLGEAGCRWTLGNNALPGHAAIGGWGHTGTFPTLDNRGSVEGTGGFYTFADQSLYHRESPAAPPQDLGVFLQYGDSDPSVSAIAQNLGAGITATGLVPGRPSDILGLGTGWAKLGDLPHTVHGSELTVETFYKLQLNSWLNLKPDLQYIGHPGGLPLHDDFVITLRAEIDF